MARLLRQAIDSGASPSLARIPMTPEQVAASYEEAEARAEPSGGSPGAGGQLDGDVPDDDGGATSVCHSVPA